MKLLLDENLSRRLVPFLQNEFPGTTQVSLVGLEQANDLAIWRFAKENGYVIVTRDADFAEIASVRHSPPQIIWIRTPNQNKAAVLNLLHTYSTIIKESCLTPEVACIELGANGVALPSSQIDLARPSALNQGDQGFTLMELAIVLFIVALLIGGMTLPVTAQMDIQSNAATQNALTDSRDSLLGFVMANDRFPCPASNTSNGVESFCDNTVDAFPCTVTPPLIVQAHGRCSNPYDGFLPAVTLGISTQDENGYAVDGWGRNPSNRIRYGVTTSNSNAFTTRLGMKNITMTTLAPDLEVCNGSGLDAVGNQKIRIPPIITAPDITAKYCHPSSRLAADAVAVIYSLGKNSGTGGTSADESHNPNPLTAVVADPMYVNANPGITFDDQLIWISKNTLFNRMVAADKLP